MKNNTSELKAMLQVQPQYASHEEWEAFAKEEHLTYEALEFSLPPVLFESGRIQDLWEWYQKDQRTTALHGAFIGVDPASGDILFQKLSRKRMTVSCKIATQLGAGNVVFHSSCCSFLRGAYMERWIAESAEFYESLAEEYNLRIFVENSQDINPDPIRGLMSRISNPDIGVCLDLGHVNYSRAPLEQWFEELGDRIGYLHLSDNLGVSDDHLPLGKGTVDWEKADRLWRMTGRGMPMTLETGNLSGVRTSLQFLKENGYFGCAEE